MKLITIVGARPQFIKSSPLSQAIKNTQNTDFQIFEKIIHTGQHFDHRMSELFFNELEITKPHFNLGISSGTHGSNTGRMLIEIEKILINEKPEGLIVYGDTDSTLAGALAASKIDIPIFHIEAGLRSFNTKMPEELNRKITDHLSSFCFAPTDVAVLNLRKEGINDSKIIRIGDIMLDAAKMYEHKAKNNFSLLRKYDLEKKI
ncbi:UDP-N-acetylglucosamine 2-epimerase, partial [Prochlorococcus sp. AH-716-B04]|nr:UDP-N-acetylglucosamine 2-epimerase [Prochlorococcus sp. AH-716-B04]